MAKHNAYRDMLQEKPILWSDRKRILGLPDTLRAFAIFPYGYPAEERSQRDRFDEARIHYVR